MFCVFCQAGELFHRGFLMAPSRLHYYYYFFVRVRYGKALQGRENCSSATPLRWSHSEKIALYSENFFSLRLTMKRLSRNKKS